MTIKIKKSDILGLLIFVFVLLWSGSPYQTIYPIVDNLQVPISFIMLALFMFVKRDGYSISFYSGSVVIFMVMILLTWTVHLFIVPTAYLKEACFIFLAFVVTQLVPFEKVVHVFVKCMTIIASVSLIGYALLNYTNLLQGLPRIANGNGVQYGIGVVFNYLTEYPERNCGIFWEPGIFASFLVIAIVFELCFNKKRRNKLRLILFFFTILTTNSSAGFALWFICLMLVITPSLKSGKHKFANFLGYLVILILPVVLINIETIVTSSTAFTDNPYISKLLPDNVVENARYLAIGHNMSIFFEYPIFGAGLAITATQMSHIADISTSTYMMSKYGILGVFYTVYWLVGIFKQKQLNMYTRILVAFVFMIIVNKETHGMIMFSWMIMFYLLRNDNFEHSENLSLNT